MKIVDFETITYKTPLKTPVLMSFTNQTHSVTTVVRLKTDEGITGVGPIYYRSRRTDTILNKEIKPILIGQDPFDVERIVSDFIRHFPALWTLEGSVLPIGAVEIACWDIMGKALGVPLYRLMGGKYRDKVPVTAFLGIKKPEDVVKDAKDAVKRGIRTLKLKVGRDLSEDIEIVKAVRQSVGDSVELRVDPNQAWSLPIAQRQIRKLREYDVQYVEQPTPRWDFDALAWLRRTTGVPIAVCEGLLSIYRAADLVRRDCADYISTDPLRMGGLSQTKKLCGLAEAAGIPVVMHIAAHGIQVAAWLHLVVSTPIINCANDIISVDGVGLSLQDDILVDPIACEEGYMRPPEKPGLGIEIDEDKLAKYAEEFERTTQDGNKDVVASIPPVPRF